MAAESNRHQIEGVKQRQSRGGMPWALVSLILATLLVVVIVRQRPVVESGGQESEEEATEAPGTPTPFIEPGPPPTLPEPVVPSVTRIQRGTDIQALSKDLDLKITFAPSDGGLASVERRARESYVADYSLQVRMPRAAKTEEELALVDKKLLGVLPGLASMLSTPQVSPWYTTLYNNKAERMKRNLKRLDQLLTRHNFYDCQTMLNLTHPESGQRIFLMQAEMDVVSDGSDGDRLAKMSEEIVNSTNYQPFTSYSWPKTSTVLNPMIAGWEKRIQNADRELSAAETTNARKAWLGERKKYLKRGLEDMKARSYLIADYDPFVVMPVNIIKDRSDPFAPNVGDYVAVIFGGKVYPAIVGDGGPAFKVGEGSLRLAKELEPRSSPYRRPVSDLTVTYVVFPRSAETPWRAPNYEHWRTRCGELLAKIGGLGEGLELHQWKDLFPKEEVVAPVEGE